MGSLSAEERPVIGQLANEVREALSEAIAKRGRRWSARPWNGVFAPRCWMSRSPVRRLPWGGVIPHDRPRRGEGYFHRNGLFHRRRAGDRAFGI
jgi:phenylalanyl-tRNA synthetase alpha chain